MRRFMIFTLHQMSFWVMKSRRMRRVRHIAHMGDRRGANGFW